MENGTSYQSIGSRTIHATNIDTEFSDGDGNDITHQNGNDVLHRQNGNGALHHSPRSTEVVLDSHQRVTIKVKDLSD
jgi:hypothetical protein